MSMSAPEVLLSVTMLRPEEKLLLEALRGRGVRVDTALPADLASLLAGRSAPPALALVRNLSHREAVDAARRLEYLGVRVVNSTRAIEVCNDKGLQAMLFESHGVPHPRSLLAFNFEQVRASVAEVGWPAVVKPVSGSWGRGVSLLTDGPCVDAWVGGRESADAASKLFPVLVQAHIDKPGHDLRVVVVGSEPVVAIRRSSDGWRTNTHLGAEVERTDVTPEMAGICEQIVKALGEGFYGVDLAEDRATGTLQVIEVNANPEFAHSSRRHGVDVAGLLSDYVSTSPVASEPVTGPNPTGVN
ncbi:ATP-dependent carboxylate-amine/thiol ligase [Nocardiopsis kunsanensis]|uniref:ATP-dependent carboxylate-amine/thiol ligase n=2 Tax=Nocardiopsis kunsanensis TaxID=141693 RepID=A0A918XHT9_9ACTN|nr:ATP-dependent carboxylate-amine/thiol ligase [Nocardiopsis kunsanensis]